MDKDMNNTADTNTREYERRSTGPEGACQQTMVTDFQVLFFRYQLNYWYYFDDDDYSLSL